MQQRDLGEFEAIPFSTSNPAEKSVSGCLSSPRGTQRVTDRLWRRNQQQPAQSRASSDRRDDGLLKNAARVKKCIVFEVKRSFQKVEISRGRAHQASGWSDR